MKDKIARYIHEIRYDEYNECEFQETDLDEDALICIKMLTDFTLELNINN